MSGDSDDVYTSEDNRKRGRGDREEEVFNRSKRTMRSPNKSQRKEEDKLDKIITMIQDQSVSMQSIKQEIMDIKNEQKEYRKEIREIKNKLGEVEKLNRELQKNDNETKKELIIVRDRIERIEKNQKANNMIIQGLTIDTSDTKQLKEAMSNFIKKELDLDVKIEAAYKLGNKTCLVRMENREDKIKIMENKKKLRYNKQERIFINNDLTKEEMRIQKEIRRRAKEESNMGHKTNIGFQKIEIEGRKWKWNKDTNKLEELSKN